MTDMGVPGHERTFRQRLFCYQLSINFTQTAIRQKEQESARNLLALSGLVLWLFNQK